MAEIHIPVMLQQFLEFFKDKEIRVFFEGTLGMGGHAEALLTTHPEIVRYVGCDQDKEAIDIAENRLIKWKDKLDIIHGNFVNLDRYLNFRDIKNVDGMFFDLGVSSLQLDKPEKGFSFQKEGPLDMRMNPDENSLTAAEIINHYSEKELGTIFKEYGEERFWRKLAKEIVLFRKKNKKFETTKELSDFILQIIGRHGKVHPATRVFQALRIAVNDELFVLRETLKKAINFLAPGGIIGVISFHSLEDRIVKHVFKEVEGIILTKKPLTPDLNEIRQNKRARSAKLRFFKKYEN